MTNFSPLNASLPNKTGERHFWTQLYGAAQSLAIYSSAVKHPGLVVVVTPDTLTATKLQFELNFFASDTSVPILNFPDWEILPYDQFSPHQDIISERLMTLYQLPQLKKGILIVSVNTLMHFTTTREYVESLTFF